MIPTTTSDKANQIVVNGAVVQELAPYPIDNNDSEDLVIHHRSVAPDSTHSSSKLIQHSSKLLGKMAAAQSYSRQRRGSVQDNIIAANVSKSQVGGDGIGIGSHLMAAAATRSEV